MKKLLMMFPLIALAITSYAQPSDAEVISRLKKGNAKIYSVQLAPGGGTLKKELVNGGWVQNYYRGYTIKMTTEHKGVNYILRGDYLYQKTGSSFSFKRSFILDGRYEGIPNPKESELLSLANSDLSTFLGGAYSSIVGDLEVLELAEKPKWYWHDLNSVSVRLKAVYSEKNNYTTIAKVEQLYEMRLYRDDMKQKFGRFICKNVGDTDARKVLSTKTYSSSEVDQMPTLASKSAKKAAQAKLDRLPKLNIPTFKTPKEIADYVHPLLQEGDKAKVEAFFIQTLSTKHLTDGVPNANGKYLIDRVNKGVSQYKSQYCDNLIITKQEKNTLKWKGKDAYVITALNTLEEKGQLKISSFYLNVSTSQSVLEAMKSFDCSKAVSTVDNNKPISHKPSYTGASESPITRAKRDGLKAGSAVIAKWASDGYWYPATVQSVSGTTYKVQYMDGYTASLKSTDLVLRELEIGDSAYVKTNAGTNLVQIDKISGSSITVKTKNGQMISCQLKQLKFK
ncbi:MAG: hypothetical protein GY810_29500 [Aureispira sp.]|nr:hypothetical protein [Aureispira sp.]